MRDWSSILVEKISEEYVKETKNENTEVLFKKVPTEMGVTVDGLRFHAVHRVGPVREARQSITHHRETPNSQAYHSEVSLSTRQKYGLGKSRQDKRDGKLQGGIFIPDLCKEYAEESYLLRQALKIARGKYNIKCHLSNNKLAMTDSSLAYSAEQLPDYLNVTKSKFNSNNVSY